MKPMMMSRAHNYVSENIADYAKRNTLYSTAAFYTSIYIWYDEIRNEIEKIIDKAALIKLNIRGWNVLKENLKLIVSEEYPKIVQEFKNKNFNIDEYIENQSFISARTYREQEISAITDVVIEAQIQKIVKQRLEILLNAFYALLGGVIGTAFTLLFVRP